MAVVFVIHLLQQVFLVADIQGLWPANIPLIIIIPSLATVAVVLQHIGDIMHAIVGMVLLLIYAVFGLALRLSVTPAHTGFQYARTSTLLFSVVLMTIPLLYFTVAVLPLLYLWEVLELDLPTPEFALLVYLVFFATAIVS